MQAWGIGVRALLLTSAVIVGCPIFGQSAAASQQQTTDHRVQSRPVAVHQISAHQPAPHAIAATAHRAVTATGTTRGRVVARGISCVPYARATSGITVAGNAWQWWDNAAGTYARGKQPEAGSVLAFRSNPRMRLGHVAVVASVINAREVLIDHANWASAGQRGGVAHSIPVVDISEANDWSAVRVGLGRSSDFGAVYPTYGFIYARPDTGMVVATATAPAPQPALNPAPNDLRPVAERPWRTYEEVAEAPGLATRRIELSSRR